MAATGLNVKREIGLGLRMGKGYWQPTPCRSVHSTGSLSACAFWSPYFYYLKVAAEILLRTLDSLSESQLLASFSKSELVDKSCSLSLLFSRSFKSSTVVHASWFAFKRKMLFQTFLFS